MRAHDRWQECFAGFDAAPDAIGDRWRALAASYAEPIRHYHNLAHVETLLALSAAHAARLRNSRTVDLAIFYHDVVYDPTRADNEMRSAAQAADELRALGAPDACIARVCALIDLTRHGAVEPDAGDSDALHFLDFDLSVLAAPAEGYDAYASAIRREYAHVPEDAYRVGRAKVLAGFLGMPKIYRVDALSAVWEASARENLTREIARLESGE